MAKIIDDTDQEIQIVYPVDKVLVKTRSEQQDIVIAKTRGFGEALFLDNHIQSCTADEYIYHEMMAHSLLLGLKSRKRVLILGSAEGCLLREVLKWNDVEEVDLVDWDETLLELFQSEYKHWNGGAFEDKRVRLHCRDATEYLKESMNGSKWYDAVFVDLLDPTEQNLPFLLGLLHDASCVKHREGGIIINSGSAVPGKNNLCEQVVKYMHNFPARDIYALHLEVPSFIQQWCLVAVVPSSWKTQICLAKVPFETRRFSQDALQRALAWEKDFPQVLREPKIDDGKFFELGRDRK